MKNTLFSVGQNRKLSKKVAVLNLPAGDPNICIGMTEVCRKICYAKKAQRCYKSARDKRQANYETIKELLKTPGALKDRLVQELKQIGSTMVRIHESGDFFCQEYVNEVFAAAAELPDVKFLAYTKSFSLDFSVQPGNFALYCSTDSSSEKLLGTGPFAHTVLKGETPPAGYVTCQHTDDKHYCGHQCFICWNGTANVYFDQH